VGFPDFDEADWREIRREAHEADAANPYPFTLRVLERKAS
jgi:hypothetical protein